MTKQIRTRVMILARALVLAASTTPAVVAAYFEKHP